MPSIDAARSSVNPAAGFRSTPSVGFKFLAVPLDLVQSGNLSPMAILLFSVIADNARWDKSGSCKLTNYQLGTRINRSPYAVKRLMNELEAAGLVRREHLAEKRIRTATFVTWVEQERPTPEQAPSVSAPGGGMVAPQVDERERPTKGIPRTPETFQTGSIPLSLSGEGPQTDPKPTPAEIAAAMRQMIAGTFAPMMFGEPKGGCAVPPPSPGGSSVSIPPTGSPKGVASTDPPKGASRRRTPLPAGPQPQPRPPDVRSMAYLVCYSARAALAQSSPPRRTQNQLLAQIAGMRSRETREPDAAG